MAAPKRKELAKVLTPMIHKSSDPAKLARQIARYLVEQRRTNDVDGLMRDIIALREQDGTVEVTVTSAFPLSQQLKRDIRSLITRSRKDATVIINEVVDPSVIGGMKVETSEQQLDITIQAKLNQLKRAIT